MIQFKSDHGDISVSSAVFSNITGMAATNCFGVKGMAFRSMTDGLVHLLRREAMSKGVSITYHDYNSIPSSFISSWRTASTSPRCAVPS